MTGPITIAADVALAELRVAKQYLDDGMTGHAWTCIQQAITELRAIKALI